MRIRGFSSLINRPGRDEDDLGFGTKMTDTGIRLINQDGSYNIDRYGRTAWHPYLALVEMSWFRFFLVVIIYYLAVNGVFGILFLLVTIQQS